MATGMASRRKLQYLSEEDQNDDGAALRSRRLRPAAVTTQRVGEKYAGAIVAIVLYT